MDIAVVIPTYHRPRELGRALESVFGQSLRPAEVAVVADGCGVRDCEPCEQTRRVVARYKGVDSFTLVYGHRHDTGAACRNFGATFTKSPWIAYLDDDNWWEPEHLKSLSEAATDKQPSFVLSGIRFWEDSSLIFEIKPCRPYHMGVDSSSFVHQRRLLEEYGPWGATGAVDQDWELVSRWLKNGESWAVTGKPTLNYTTRRPWAFMRSYVKNRVTQALGFEIHRTRFLLA